MRHALPSIAGGGGRRRPIEPEADPLYYQINGVGVRIPIVLSSVVDNRPRLQIHVQASVLPLSFNRSCAWFDDVHSTHIQALFHYHSPPFSFALLLAVTPFARGRRLHFNIT